MGEQWRDLLQTAQAHLRAGDQDAALKAAAQACQAAPEISECHNALGVIYRAAQRYEDAAAAYQAALERDPNNARALNNLGEALRRQGEPERALPYIERALELDPNRGETLRNLAECHVALAQYNAAVSVARHALRLAPKDAHARLLLGKAEHERGRIHNAIEAYRQFLDLVPDHVDTLCDLGAALVRIDDFMPAIAAFKKALELDPGNMAAEFGLSEARAKAIPPWHIPMMNEPLRNLAYRDAIRALVKPGDLVLEIGAGAGLLSMMAAEAGAKQVVTCEMVDEVAQTAKEIIARNHFADRVKVVSKHSSGLTLGEDLPERADVMVSEILANDFVGEGVLPSLNDAMKRLLKPGARIIPSHGAIMGVLVGGEEIEYRLRIDEVCGFDVSPFAKLRPWRQTIPNRIDYDALSADTALAAYDFSKIDTLAPLDATISIPALKDGLCYGLMQWIAIDLAPGIRYENHPQNVESVWNKVLYAFPEPIMLRAGESLDVRLWQRGDYLYITARAPSG